MFHHITHSQCSGVSRNEALEAVCVCVHVCLSQDCAKLSVLLINYGCKHSEWQM